jgi:hypothetical protein
MNNNFFEDPIATSTQNDESAQLLQTMWIESKKIYNDLLENRHVDDFDLIENYSLTECLKKVCFS